MGSSGSSRTCVYGGEGDLPAVEFAGIQCHIQFGDYNEEKHKPGLIENLSEYLPEQYCSAWGIEKKILKEFSKHVGLAPLEAKHLYTKTARELPTYGVTFFLVKEVEKGKKKLIHRLLGINAEAILRLDERTKEVIQQWPLTHVKTYSAGKGNSFTLNFGDYATEEYSVKTRDAFRIRDILEGYIDLIRKRMLEDYHRAGTEHGAISSDNVAASQASVITVVSNNPMKLMEHSLVGPSQIIHTETGQPIVQGAQIMTVQQVITSGLYHHQAQGVKREAPKTAELQRSTSTRLKRVNSKSVKVVTFLTDPTETNIDEARKLVEEMNEEMPHVKEGIQLMEGEAAEELRRKLQQQMDELELLMKTLDQNTSPEHLNPSEAEAAAMKIAEASTQMYLALDPATRRRSDFIKRSRASFIADERTELKLRLASYIAASGSIHQAMEQAHTILAQEYVGPALDSGRVRQLEECALDKIARINAAIAHHLLAHADPHNIDYATGVNSLNTINELLPELAKDAQLLGSVKEGQGRQELLDSVRSLGDAAKAACALKGNEDKEKLRELVQNYTQSAGKLMFILGNGAKPNGHIEKQVLELAYEADQHTCSLVGGAQQLSADVAARPAVQLFGDATKTLEASSRLCRQAELTAPTIHEPHCQSALRAASEDLFGSVQQLGSTWAPLVQDKPDLADKLQADTLNIGQALDKLKPYYTTSDDAEMQDVFPQESNISSILGNFQFNYMASQDLLNKPLKASVSDAEVKVAEMRLAEKLGKLNAALAGLSKAYADNENPDKAAAESAISTINDLLPQIAKDARVVSAHRDEESRAAMMEQTRALFNALEALRDGPSKFTEQEALAASEHSGKLVYTLGKRINPERENQVMELTLDACKQASSLLAGVKRLAEAEGGEAGAALDERGAALADHAGRLMHTAQVTAATLSATPCRELLGATADDLVAEGERLARTWAPLGRQPRHTAPVAALDQAWHRLRDHLDRLANAADMPDISEEEMQEPSHQTHKLKYTHTLGGFKNNHTQAMNEVNKPLSSTVSAADEKAAENRLTDSLARLNAALAALSKAYADRDNIDYAAAETAISTINELMPAIAKDTRMVSANKDEENRAAMMEQTRALLTALENITNGPDKFTEQEALAISEQSGKLVYTLGKRINPERENLVMELTLAACKQASSLLAGVKRLEEAEGGEAGAALDERGAALADHAGRLMHTAQVTAATLSAAPCRELLSAAADDLAAKGEHLARTWAPLGRQPRHTVPVAALDQTWRRLRDHLDRLANAADMPDIRDEEMQEPSHQAHKLKFTHTLGDFKNNHTQAMNEVNKPLPSTVSAADEKAAENRLADSLARLNAALAALSKAYADKDNIDYAAAETVISTINELMPAIAKDTRMLSANRDEENRAAMMEQTRALLTALENITNGPDKFTEQEALAMSEQSGKLVYTLGKRINPERENQVMELTLAACKQTSELLQGVKRLEEAEGGEAGAALDERGAALADKAGRLMHTAQVTAATLSAAPCRELLGAAADDLAAEGERLARTWAPLGRQPRHTAPVAALDQAWRRLRDHLDRLASAADMPDIDSLDQLQDARSELPSEKKKLVFINTMRGMKDKLEKAEKELDKPVMPAKGSDMEAVQRRLSQSLGTLNAAVTSLHAATADSENPDFVTAQQSVTAITELMPQIIKDMKTVSTMKDAPSREQMVSRARELCRAAHALCSSSDDAQDFKKAVRECGAASNKLVFTISPNSARQLAVDVADGAKQRVALIHSEVGTVAGTVGGVRGEKLRGKSAALTEAAAEMLQSAQVLEPSVPLLARAAVLSHAALSLREELQSDVTPATWQHLNHLDGHLDRLAGICEPIEGIPANSEEQKQQRLQFVKSVKDAQAKCADADKQMKKPATPARGADAEVQDRLCQRLAQHTTAVAALVTALSDREHPDYATAQQSMATIADTIPQLVKDVKTIGLSRDETTRAAMTARLQDLCHATSTICAGADGKEPKMFGEAVRKLADASTALVHEVSPKVNLYREQQIKQLAKEACAHALQLQSEVDALAKEVGGERGVRLGKGGRRVAEASSDMDVVAQLTATSVSSAPCREQLHTAAALVSLAALPLRRDVTALCDVTPHHTRARAAKEQLQMMEGKLDGVRKACLMADDANPPLSKPAPPSKPAKPAPPRRAPAAPKSHIDATSQFLDTLRREESQGVGEVQSSSQALVSQSQSSAADVRARKRFEDICASAADHIRREGEKLQVSKSSSCNGDVLSYSGMMQQQQQLTRQLARAAVQVAATVAATYGDKVEFEAASESITTLAQLMAEVAASGDQLSESMPESGRQSFIQHVTQVCDAARNICETAPTGREKVNECAVQFGHACGKLLSVVSDDCDPALEKEIISRAKAIGDSVSRLAGDTGTVVTSARGTAVCEAGTDCVTAAGKLLYTAKVTAAMIHESCCQEALLSSTDALSSSLQTFRTSWASIPQHSTQTLDKEADVLQKLLEELRSDVKDGALVKRREVERMVVENTPMRELTVKILEGAKSYTESADMAAGTKVEYASYCDRLARALRDLDLACTRYKKTPHDSKKRRDLDNAIQNLQIELLQTRPSRGDKGNSNIVDLRDFIEEMSEEVKTLTKAAQEVKVSSPHDAKILENIREKCAAIETKGRQLMQFDDMDEIDIVGEECNALISKIDAEIKQIEDSRAKRVLLKHLLPLTQACDMMRFATKSSVSATASASLDATLGDIEDVEARLIGTVVNDSQQGVTPRNQPANRSSAASAVCRELCSPAGVSRAALTAYVAATCSGKHDNKSVRHVQRVCELVKAHAAARAARALLWQHTDTPDVAVITQNILQEMSSHSDGGAEVKDIGKLLVPSAPKILGDQSQQEEILQSLSSKLSSLCGELVSNQQLPPKIALQEYSKRGAAVVATAVELDAVARGTSADTRQMKKVDEAAKEMKVQTYNVLKIAEEAANDPQNPYWSRKLPAACDRLNAAINNLVLRSSRAPPVSQRCGCISRDMERRVKGAAPRPSPQPYDHAVAALDQQKENIYKLKSSDARDQQQFLREVDELGVAVRKSTDFAENCAYFIAVSDTNKDIARTGAVDVDHITATIQAVQDACLAVIGAPDTPQAIDGKEELHKRVQEFSWAMEKAQAMVKDEDTKLALARTKDEVCEAADDLDAGFKEQKPLGDITSRAVSLLSCVSGAHATVTRSALVPPVAHMTPDTRARCDDVITHSQHLVRHTLQLLQEVQSSPAAQQDSVSWNSFSSRKKLIDSYDALVKTVKVNGHRSGVLLNAPDEELDKEEEVPRSYVDTQVDLAHKWLRSPTCKAEVKAEGQQAARNVIDLARQMSEEQSGTEREETRLLVNETEELLTHCVKSYDQERNSLLMDRLKALNKCISRGIVTRVLHNFMEADEPLEHLQLLDHHHDVESSKREFILERKIAELLAQLGRVTRTARLVAATRPPQALEDDLRANTEQTELLAPMLVQAAQKRIDHPNDSEAIEKYQSVLAEYTAAIARMRELCDRAVDPMDFVQAAGDTMQRMHDDLSAAADPQKCHQTSIVINRLADRVMLVGMSSPLVSRDPALAAEVSSVCERVTSARPPPATRASRLPDWRETTTQVLRMTGAVESALGGENIFKQQPTAANQPIYSVARDLHECVREWSSRDNDIVAAARRMAVLMARLSEYMETEKKQALITTSKSIVSESQEVAELAKKLAHECTDVRIKTNLLQLVERIPTISGQLKMLITVKGSSLGQQGNFEDKEAMDMLVVNAQSLMMSIQEVVKAAAGASVKIMSQRGPRLRWVRKNYY